jgi:uncharacterized membrane protein
MDIEDIISLTLRLGLLLSISIMTLGFILSLNNPIQLDRVLYFNTSIVTTQKLVSGLISLKGFYFIILGLIILIATPVLRVLLMVIQFLRQGETTYFAFSLLVFIIMIIAIIFIPSFIL